MISRTLWLLVLFAAFAMKPANTGAQTPSAVVKDATSGAPVAYANVGIPAKGTGTVTTESGAFTLEDFKETDTVSVSMIGYEAKKFLAAKLPPIILLARKSEALDEIVVKPRKTKKEWIGSQTRNPFSTVGIQGGKLGSGMAALLTPPFLPCYVKEVRFQVAKCSYDSIFLRLVVLEQTESGFKELLHQPVYVRLPGREGAKGISVSFGEGQQPIAHGNLLIGLEVVRDLG